MSKIVEHETVEHEHQYGEGYSHAANGVTYMHTKVCRVCLHRLDTPIVEQPKKSTGPSVSGLSSGERLR